MTEQNFSLSNYQKAVLQQMGISYWSLSDDASTAGDGKAAQEEALSDAAAQPRSELSAADKIAALRSVGSKTVVKESTPTLASEAQVSIEPVPAPVKKQPKSIPGKVLLVIPQEFANNMIVSDVKTALGITEEQVVTSPLSEISEYCDYVLAWQMGKTLELASSILTTPSPESLANGDNKKRLWSLIAEVSLSA